MSDKNQHPPSPLTKKHYRRLGLLVTLIMAGVIWLLLDLRPQISVNNGGAKPLSAVQFDLSHTHISFGEVAAFDSQTIYHLPLSNAAVVRFSLQFADGSSTLGRCGKLGDWALASRVSLDIDELGAVRCEVR
ncbi:hypothetical protein DU002_12400 [Corallincola holothuriorum]|uniref:Transmembrane protein n=1 Tax=Corallincola holothuriorum TaxID=2282215 RepID=A0A368NI99_9GAMM|nr:hypothetical protein [Corallincola holothuriorum]RCU49149.1 hypothetical protein DU002_12400 [Corallincola holothuriorum]